MPWRKSLALEQQERKQHQLWRSRKLVSSAQSIEIERDGKRYLNFCSNDYLGLANHPQSIAASISASSQWGTGTGASHLVCGHQTPHHQLELDIAEFVGAEKALVFSAGYMANLAVPQSFLGRNDLLLQDKLNHASLIDAAKLCRAKLSRYSHCDMNHLAKLMTNFHSPREACRKLITTDSVFSMDGDIAPIDKLDALAEKHGAVLLIDDAHGFGVLGDQGKGTYSHFSLAPTMHRLMLGTLGKALGGFGAFVAGDAIYIDQIAQHARSYIYTTALPANITEATRTALRTVQKEPQLREKLSDAIHYFRQGAVHTGLELMPSETPIQPILLGDEATALQASQILENESIWVSAIRPPTVPKNTARLRITISAKHKEEHIDRLLDALIKVKKFIE